MRFVITALAAAILLSSCATSTTNYYTSSVQSWHGNTVRSLAQQWGRPDYQATSPSGKTTLAYKTESYSVYTPPTGATVGRPTIVVPQNTNNTWNRGSLSISCTVIFEANKQGVITNSKIVGQNCYGGQNFAKKYANPKANVLQKGND